MSTAGWYSVGRAFAFVYAAGWFAGTWIFTLVSFAIISPQPPDAADRVAHYAYERAVYPQLYLAVVCIVVAMLCFIGLGLVLRHFFAEDGPRQQLMAAAFAAAGMFGSLWLFLTLGLLSGIVVGRFSRPLPFQGRGHGFESLAGLLPLILHTSCTSSHFKGGS